MATIALTRDEAGYHLPAVCMCCGEPAEVYRSRVLYWKPPWVWLLILSGIWFIILQWFVTRRMRIEAPFCGEHKGHWTWRWVLPLGFLVVLAGCSAAYIMLNGRLGRFHGEDLNMVVRGFALGGIGIVLLLLTLLHSTSIHATEMTDEDVILTNVCEEFVEAVEARRTPRYATAVPWHMPAVEEPLEAEYADEFGDYLDRHGM